MHQPFVTMAHHPKGRAGDRGQMYRVGIVTNDWSINMYNLSSSY